MVREDSGDAPGLAYRVHREVNAEQRRGHASQTQVAPERSWMALGRVWS